MYELFKQVEQGWEYLPPPPEFETEAEYIAYMEQQSELTGTPHRVEKSVEGGSVILNEA